MIEPTQASSRRRRSRLRKTAASAPADCDILRSADRIGRQSQYLLRRGRTGGKIGGPSHVWWAYASDRDARAEGESDVGAGAERGKSGGHAGRGRLDNRGGDSGRRGASLRGWTQR